MSRGAAKREGALFSKDSLQIRPRDIFHDDERGILFFFDGKDTGNMGMDEPGHSASFFKNTLIEGGIETESRVKNFDDNVATKGSSPWHDK